MREPRNPFRLRAAEHIESDVTFIRLFEPDVLDVLPVEALWDSLHFLRSAPGGGKTSLIRLFTPTVLLTLHAHRNVETCKELHQRMMALGALDDAGPRILGVTLSCARNYATLEDIDFEPGRQERLLFGLLNARIVLATLRGALALRKLSYPDDLERLNITISPTTELPPGLYVPCNGLELYQWARNLELTVGNAIDGFEAIQAESLPGHETLLSLTLLKPEFIKIDGKPAAERILLMLDDAHKLTREQRGKLVRAIFDLRSSAGIWIAERLDVLSTDEMLAYGATEGRDYESIILLESSWRKKRRQFEKLVLKIAERRASATSDVEIGSFSSSLDFSLDGTERQSQMEQVVSSVAARVRILAGNRPLYHEWLAAREMTDGTLYEKAVAWRSLEILMERENRRIQPQLFEWPLSAEELRHKDDSGVKGAAELFLAREFGLPYYFGPERLAAAASTNIEQFLWLAGDHFEEMVSAALIRKPTFLAPERQEAIIKKAVQTRWQEIPRRMRNGQEVKAFLDAMGQFAKWITYQPNAPYDYGVTGIAILMTDREKLRDAHYLKRNPHHARLAAILASALAHNLLEPIPNYKCKSDLWMVLYFNRLLCVNFGLPLQQGGFKEKRLTELSNWIEHGFKPAKSMEIPL